MTNAQTTQRIDCKMSKRLDTKLNRCTSVQVEHLPLSNAHTYCETDLTRANATKRINMAFGTSIPWNASEPFGCARLTFGFHAIAAFL